MAGDASAGCGLPSPALRCNKGRFGLISTASALRCAHFVSVRNKSFIGG